MHVCTDRQTDTQEASTCPRMTTDCALHCAPCTVLIMCVMYNCIGIVCMYCMWCCTFACPL